jgi:hypothetical protein
MKTRILAAVCLTLSVFALGQAAHAQEGGQTFRLPEPFDQTSPFTQIRLPIIFSNPRVPTDLTGPGGSLGRAKGLKGEILGITPRRAIPDVRHVPRDERFAFTGTWQSVDGVAVSTVRSALVYPNGRQLIATRPHASDTVVAVRGRMVGPATGSCLMPTEGAVFNRLSENEVELSSGALLVKANDQGVIVSATSCGKHKALVTVERGATAMVSCFDNRVTVINLLSNADTHVKLFVPHAASKTFEVMVPLGTQASFSGEQQPVVSSLTLAPGKQILEHALPDGARVHTFPIDYTTTLKVHGIARALPEEDYKKMLHTAAAVSLVRAM